MREFNDSFLSWVVLTNFLSHDETGHNLAKNETSQKRNINTKKPYMVFSQASGF